MMTSRLRALDDDLPPNPHPGEPEGSPRRRFLGLEIFLIATSCWVAAAAFRPVFVTVRTFTAPTLIAVTLATAIGVGAARRDVPARWSLVGSAVVAAVFVAYTILVGALAGGVVPGPETVSGLRDGIGRGFSTMLGDSLPLSNHTLALVFVTLASWFAAALATELTQRSAIPSLPLVAPLALFALAMPIVAPTHPPSAWHIGGFIALLLVIVLVRAVPDPRTTGTVIGPRVDGLAEFHSRSLLSSRLALGVPLIVLCAAVAPILGDVVTNRRPFDPRNLRDQQVEAVRVDDPLGEYKRIVGQTPAVPAFRVTLTGTTPLEIARVAVVRLDVYDGVHFTTSDRYAVAGPVLIHPEDRPSSGRDVILKFSDLGLDDPWLPTGGTPTRIDLRGVGFDPRSGDLLAPGSVKGLGYEIRARVTIATSAELAAIAVDSRADADPYRALPGGLPPNIGRIAGEVTAGAASPGEALDKLMTFFRTGFAVEASSPAGHSAGRLDQFLRIDRSGNAEQFATAFTAMARSLGYPSRVVVGYKLVADDKGTVRPLEFVTSASYHVWSEVKFDGLGWITYDPTPSSGVSPSARVADPVAVPEVVTPTTAGEQRTPSAVGPSEADPASSAGSAWWRPYAWGLGVVGSVAALVGAVVGSILILKARRRRRRRGSGPAADRIVGAWDEVIDRLVELHFPVTPSMTPREVARATQAIYGTAAALPLSFLVPDVGRAVFSRHEPDEAVVDRSWVRALEFEQNLAITLNRRQRWRARVSVRALRGPHSGEATRAT